MTTQMPQISQPIMTAPAPTDIISPAEARFWQEWADKVPGLMRTQVQGFSNKFNSILTPWKVGGVVLGTTLGVASFTKAVPGKWKWVSGGAAVASLTTSYVASLFQRASMQVDKVRANYADTLERDPELRQKLADFLSSTVTADKIQDFGIEYAVLMQANAFGRLTQYLQIEMKNGAAIGYDR